MNGFSEWKMNWKKEQTHLLCKKNSLSSASSYDDTDVDSDCDSEHYGAFASFSQEDEDSNSRNSVTSSRSEPITIPQGISHSFSDCSKKQTVSAKESSYLRQSYCSFSSNDEDDFALYNNLAYFKSKRTSTQPSNKMNQERSEIDEDIFDFEL
jgi:hypothetical protein